MYYDRVPSIIEGNDLVAVRALDVEHLENGRRLLHVTFELRQEKVISTNTADLRLHVTDGATHILHEATPYVAPVVEEEAEAEPVEEAASEEETAPVEQEEKKAAPRRSSSRARR